MTGRFSRVLKAIALTASLALAGCHSSGELVVEDGVGISAVRSPCPAVGIPDYTGDITLFNDPDSRDSRQVDVVASMTDVRSTCDSKSAKVKSDVTFRVQARRADARGERDLVLPYFVTVMRGSNSVVAKRVGLVTVHFADGQSRAEAVAKGPFAKDTLIFVLEDDAQDGADHVSAHRSLALVVGPYVKQGAVISKRYTTVNVLRTMVDILGVEPLGLNDAMAEPMSDIFDVSQASWSYKSLVPPVLRSTALPLPPAASACVARPKRSAAWWAAAMAGQDFSSEDKLDTARFNRALWTGLKGKGTVSYDGGPGCQ